MPTASGAPLCRESANGNLGVSSPRGRQVPFAPTSRTEFFRKLLESLSKKFEKAIADESGYRGNLKIGSSKDISDRPS